jgi:hypothetical protein
MTLKPAAPIIMLSAALWSGAAAAGSLLGGRSVHTGDGPLVDGSGQVVTQVRPLPAFDAIQTKNAVEVEVHVGQPASVTVEFDDNLQRQISTEVQNNTLLIEAHGSWSASHDPKVRVTVPALSALATEGSGSVAIDGLKGGDFALRLVGSGDIGASGRVASLGVLLNGSGDMNLAHLEADSARVRLNGSGDVHVNASRTLEAVVYGTGDIRYRGAATVSSHAYGTGSIEKD